MNQTGRRPCRLAAAAEIPEVDSVLITFYIISFYYIVMYYIIYIYIKPAGGEVDPLVLAAAAEVADVDPVPLGLVLEHL